MKLISADNAKTLVILTAAGAIGYVLWKLYSAGAGIKNTVTHTVGAVSDAARAAAHEAELAIARAGAVARNTALGGAPGGTIEDQSDAETARLVRQAAAGSTTLPPAPVPEAAGNGDYRPAVPEEGVPAWTLGSQSSSYDQAPVDQQPQTALG